MACMGGERGAWRVHGGCSATYAVLPPFQKASYLLNTCVLLHLQEGKTALHVAASKGHPQAVAELLAAGAPVDILTLVSIDPVKRSP